MSKTQTMPLDQFVTFQRGFDLPKTQFSEGKYPVYGSTSIIGYHNEFKVKAPGVITGRSGTLGNFQTKFKVYNKEDKKILNFKIRRIKQSGRSTFFCPDLQKSKYNPIFD